MRILIVNDYAFEAGGAETYVFALVALLKSKGHAVRLVGDKPRLIHYFSRIFNPWYLCKFTWIILTWKPEVLHINKCNLVYSFVPALVGRIFGVNTLMTLHDVGLFCPDGFGIRGNGQACEKFLDRGCFNSQCYRSTSPFLVFQRRMNFIRNMIILPIHRYSINHFLCCSRFLMVWTQKYYGDRTHYMPNFIDVPNVPPLPPKKNQGALKIFFAGRLVLEKGLQFLIPALKEIDVQLEVAGNGVYLSSLQALAKWHGVTDKIFWLGKIPNTQISEKIEQSDFCILPSIWMENLPMFALEAMKCAKPLIASNIGGLPDLVEDRRNGFLVEKGNSKAIQGILIDILKNRDSVEKMGYESYTKLQRDFGSESHYIALMKLYQTRKG